MNRIKFVIARYEDDRYAQFLKTSIEDVPNDYMKVHVPNDSVEPHGLNEKYNLGTELLMQNGGIADNDVVCFCHADVKILDTHFQEKLLYAFDNLDIGVAGVIGTTRLEESGGWWHGDKAHHRGHIMQWVDEKEETKYHMVRSIGSCTNMTVIDGVCMFVRGSLLKKQPFDSTTYVGAYDFYDYDYCLTALAAGSKVAVLDILLEHGSAGRGVFKDSWSKNREIFLRKWASRGVGFPIISKAG